MVHPARDLTAGLDLALLVSAWPVDRGVTEFLGYTICTSHRPDGPGFTADRATRSRSIRGSDC